MKAEKLLPKISDYKVVVDKEIQRGSFIYDAGAIDVARDIRNALGGGECIRCGKPWRKVVVKNVYASFEYWTPACKCYPVCRKVLRMERIKGTGRMGTIDVGCGKVLYEEFDGAVKKVDGKHYVTCDNCETVIAVDRWIQGEKDDRYPYEKQN